MIVVDANILIYSLVECEQSELVRQLRERDPDWRTTTLCLHETLNVLATYQRRGVLTLAQCKKLLVHAERFVELAQGEVEMESALGVAAEYGITGYDAQYVALAQGLHAPLITEDKKLRAAVPEWAYSMKDFMVLHDG